MDKLKRKLALLNIPVYEIKDEKEIASTLSSHLEFVGNDLVNSKLNIYFGTKDYPFSTKDENLNVIVFQTLLAVEESSILFVDKNVNDNIKIVNISHYSALVIQERNIVDSIEVALHRISIGSDYYNNYMEVISPESIPYNSIIIIKD